MLKHTFIYADQEAFETGECDGVQWEAEALRLAGGCRQGSWTSPVQPCPSFDWLVPSWNAAVPAGAGLRVSVRLELESQWTPWMDWGLWSPLKDEHRQPPLASRCAEAVIRTGILRSELSAGAFQMRLDLTAGDDGSQPAVYLAAVSVRPLAKREDDAGEPLYHRTSQVPAYSQMNRDPRMAGHMGGATCAAMLLDRWGEDLLPEKVAHLSQSPAGSWEDPAYLSGVMGLFGYPATAEFCGVSDLKKQLKAGCACAAALRTDEGPRWLVVRGFDTDESGTQQVLVNDPDADTDAGAEKVMALEEFSDMWMGLALMMHQKNDRHTAGAPAWASGELRAGEVPGTWTLLRGGERVSLPVDLCQRGGRCRGTLCYTVADGRAYASTAHKRFFYTDVAPTGDILLDTACMPAGTRLTVYVIQPGLTITACLTL